MKFIAYNVRQDERAYFENWSQKNNIEIEGLEPPKEDDDHHHHHNIEEE